MPWVSTGSTSSGVSVPNTDTFSLTDVYAAVADHQIPSNPPLTGDLSSCFARSIAEYFDPSYNNDSYAPANSMKRFRNYHPYTDDLFVPDGFSPDGDGVHDFFDIYNLWLYPSHRVMIFDRGGTKLYERTNDYVENPWDGYCLGVLQPAATYIVIIQIEGTTVYNGTFAIVL